MFKSIRQYFFCNLMLCLTGLLSSLLTGLVLADPTSASSPGVNDRMPTFECLIQPDMIVNITSSIDGIIDAIYVDNSDHVKKGQILAQLESEVQKATVAVAKSRATRQDEIQLRETELAFSKRTLTRIIELHDKRSVSPSEKDQAETAVELANIELQKARNNHELANLEYIQAKRALEMRAIRSPIDGVIVNRTASPGESTEDRPIFTIAKVDPLRVELIIPVEYFGFITPGMKTRIIPELTSSKEYIATVTVVDKIIDAPSGTFSVRLSLPNPKQQLPGGLKCQAQFL